MSINKLRIEKFLREENEAKRLGILVKYMCLTLSCVHHQSLHAELLDVEKIKEIYNTSSVPNGCSCAVVQILVDAHGEPLTPSIIRKAKTQLNGKIT